MAPKDAIRHIREQRNALWFARMAAECEEQHARDKRLALENDDTIMADELKRLEQLVADEETAIKALS